MGQSSPEAKKAWLSRNAHKRPEINRNCRLRAFYGITPEQYQDMYDAQEGKCAICKNEFQSSTDAHLDHNHETRWVRGILCSNCNLGIGNFHDNVTNLQAAIEYLIANSTPTEFTWQKVPVPKREKSEYQREAASLANIGNKHREGKSPWNKGKSWSEETKDKMSKSATNRPPVGKETRQKCSQAASKRWSK